MYSETIEMKLPSSVYGGFNLMKKSRVVMKKATDDDALEYFKKILNAAQPTTDEDMILYKFVKGLYNENRYKFMSFIKNMSFECLVLWTESKAIINALNLRGVVYLKWTGKETLYDVTKFKSSRIEGDPVPFVEHPLVARKRTTEKKHRPLYKQVPPPTRKNSNQEDDLDINTLTTDAAVEFEAKLLKKSLNDIRNLDGRDKVDEFDKSNSSGRPDRLSKKDIPPQNMEKQSPPSPTQRKKRWGDWDEGDF